MVAVYGILSYIVRCVLKWTVESEVEVRVESEGVGDEGRGKGGE